MFKLARFSTAFVASISVPEESIHGATLHLSPSSTVVPAASQRPN